jgi:hypothetical protein
VALGLVFSEYFGFHCQFSFHHMLHIHHLSSGAATIGQLVANVPSGLSLTPPQRNYLEEYEGAETFWLKYALIRMFRYQKENESVNLIVSRETPHNKLPLQCR